MNKTPKESSLKKEFPSLGFPDGKFAESIRKTISPEFSDHDVESITIILVSHLMIERKINTLLLKWMADRLPKMGTKNKKNIPFNVVAREDLEKTINALDFQKKLNLIKPLGILLWGDDSIKIFKDFQKINNFRVEIAHRLDLEKIKVDNLFPNTEKGIERFLNLAQQRLLNISDLIELIDN